MESPATTCEATEATAGRLDRLVRQWRGLSKSAAKAEIAAGRVIVNGQVVRQASREVAVGDRLQWREAAGAGEEDRPSATSSAPAQPRSVAGQRAGERPGERSDSGRRQAPRSPPFEILYEDEYLLAVDKAAWILTVATDAGGSQPTLVEALTRYLRQSTGRRNAQAYPVHRLDRGTSGVLVFARSPEIAGRLEDVFRHHQVRREYVALAAGAFEPAAGTIESYLATDPRLLRFSASPHRKDVERAVTHYRTERRLAGASLVRAWLETGRRNQIRVHFAEAGHPVLGDARYRPRQALHPGWRWPRHALHAQVLSLRHPVDGTRLEWRTELPAEFVEFINRGGDAP